ncbi:NAD(P)H-dependent oxidoreductase [Ferrimonas marina]|nr:NAD(P)H-dependent oxidoreductase [Ferrimonas marina]
MKILNLVFHPDLSQSRVNQRWKQQLEDSGKVALSRDMYAEYPDYQIDVEREQQLLAQYDRIVLQFPLYWYASPPLLKKWLDDVLTYQFAYGSQGDRLKGKDLQLIVSVGGRQKFYSGFDMFTTIPDLLRPFQLTANLTQMNYLIPVWMFRADAASPEEIEEYGSRWVEMIDDPRRSDPRAFLNESMASDADSYYDA